LKMSHEDWAQKPRQILKKVHGVAKLLSQGGKKVITESGECFRSQGRKSELRTNAGKLATETQDGKDKENPGVRPLRGVKGAGDVILICVLYLYNNNNQVENKSRRLSWQTTDNTGCGL